MASIVVHSSFPAASGADITVVKNQRWDESDDWPTNWSPYERQPLSTWWASPWLREPEPQRINLLVLTEPHFADHYDNYDHHGHHEQQA